MNRQRLQAMSNSDTQGSVASRHGRVQPQVFSENNPDSKITSSPRNGESSRPFYVATGHEEEIFKAAFSQGLTIVLKGPTGCGKTRFVEAMAYDLNRSLLTVACHDDLTTADLVGRYLLRGGETEWVDGPLTRAVREGSICYLDEIVEARQDTTVVLHPLADHRRQLPIERLGIELNAAPGFGLVVSYNPGYQSVLKDLKDSTRQRMIAIEFSYPSADVEQNIVINETGIKADAAEKLVKLAHVIRRLETPGLREVASTRVLIAAGRLMAAGIPAPVAAHAAIAAPLSDDATVVSGLTKMIELYIVD